MVGHGGPKGKTGGKKDKRKEKTTAGTIDKRKPKHSKDANRPNSEAKGQRSSATVRLSGQHLNAVMRPLPAPPPCLPCLHVRHCLPAFATMKLGVSTHGPPACSSSGQAPQHVQHEGHPRQEGEAAARGGSLRRLLSRPILHARSFADSSPLQLLSSYAAPLMQDLQSKELPSTRIVPDRRWFGNTRVIGQKQLDQFRDEMSSKVNDAYTVLLREKKLPLQLLEDPEKKQASTGKTLRVNLLATQPFDGVFGKNKKRKRPTLAMESMEDYMEAADKKAIA